MYESKPQLGQLTRQFLQCVFRRGKRLRLQHVAIVLSAVLVVAYRGSIAISLTHPYHQAVPDAVTIFEGMARSAEIEMSRSVDEIDGLLRVIERMLVTVLAGEPLGDSAIKTLLREVTDQSSAVSNIVILDGNARDIDAASATVGHIGNFGEPLTTCNSGVLPLRLIERRDGGRSNEGWSILETRPLVRENGFRGAIVAEIPMTIFLDLYHGIVTSGGTQIGLLKNDDTLVANQPHRAKKIGGVPIFAPSLPAVAKEKMRLLSASTDEEGQDSVRGFRAVPGYPLIVTVSREHAEILRQWYEKRSALVGIALFSIIAATLAWLVYLGRQQLAAAYFRRSEARSALLQGALENIAEGLSVFDRLGRLAAWNSRFCELLELPSDLPAGTTLRDVLMVQAARGDFGNDAPETEVARRLEGFYRDVPTVKERVTQAGRLLQIRRGTLPDGAVVSLYSDITELRASERKMLQARSQAEFANRSKSDFLANMSHELRTPLNAIIGFSEVISNELFGPIANERYLEYMKDIHASSLHLLSIINDVLDMSKIEAGKLELSREALNLTNVVADAIRMVHERAGRSGIELIALLPDKEVHIWADERAMKQVLLNLLSNAIKFSKPGGKVYLRVITDVPGRVLLEIEDCGIGMNDDEQDRALLPFGQAQSGTTRNYGGTGLGLPITKGLVEAHGGTLTIKSRIGCGTTVGIVMPTEREPRLSQVP